MRRSAFASLSAELTISCFTFSLYSWSALTSNALTMRLTASVKRLSMTVCNKREQFEIDIEIDRIHQGASINFHLFFRYLNGPSAYSFK